MSILDQIKKGHSRVFRRAYIKRRDSTGQFESEWFEISKYIKKWGKIKTQIDAVRLNKFNFGNVTLVVENDEGLFNPHDQESSLWFEYLPQQRTLVKIVTGFIDQNLGSDGVWNNDFYLEDALWDESEWDTGSDWDGVLPAFYGVINGDISLSDTNEVSFNISPVTQIFRDYPARNLTGFDDSITASRFMELVRDQQDVNGTYIFRPFFGGTTTYWDISTTTVVYTNLNTNAAKDIRDMNVWEVIEKLSEAENHVTYISNEGVFKFRTRDVTTTVSFEFFGGNSIVNATSPNTIKRIQSYGKKISDFYTRVDVQWVDDDTTTSHEIRESTLTVAAGNLSWEYGQKTLDIQNYWIPTSTVAETIAQTIYNEVSTLKNNLEFTTSFIPHLSVLDRVSVSYDNSPILQENLWDVNNWADTAGAATNLNDLIWDQDVGSGIKINEREFKFHSIEMDLDKLECKFIAREV